MSVVVGPPASGGSGGGGDSPMPAILNYDPAYLTNYWSARDAVAAGTRNLNLVLMGDSAVLSYGASSTANQQAVNAMDAQLAKLFKGAGIPAGYQCCFGDHGVGWENWDSRAANTGFVSLSGFFIPSFGGYGYAAQSAGTLSFHPNVSTSQCDIYYLGGANSGTFQKQVNSDTAVDVTISLTEGLYKTTLTKTLGDNTWKALWKSGVASIQGFNAYDSAVKQISLMNCGWSGSTAQQWAKTDLGYSPINAMSALAPDVVYVTESFNDYVFNGRTLAQAETDLIALVDAAKAVNSDVIISGYVPLAEVAGSPYNVNVPKSDQIAINNMLLGVAKKKKAIFIDMLNRWGGDYAPNNAAGRMYDFLHKSGLGCGDAAAVLYSLLAFK